MAKPPGVSVQDIRGYRHTWTEGGAWKQTPVHGDLVYNRVPPTTRKITDYLLDGIGKTGSFCEKKFDSYSYPIRR